jgi:cholest-4-en-3-one 26-monooxygenase
MEAPSPMIPDFDPLDLVDPERFARNGYPHAVWTRLRAEAPVARFEPPGFRPFWAITRHADIAEISSQPLRFSNAYGITLASAGQPIVRIGSEMVVMLDPPRHRPVRKLASPRFTPRAVRAHRADVERIAAEILDRAATGSATGECDFVERVAAPLPIAVIAWILGLARDDWDLLYRWTNEVIGASDPEFRRDGETPARTARRARKELHAYFERLIEKRRSKPGNDLVSELLGADIEGEPVPHDLLLQNCELFVEAGNETTRNAISGGLLAFSEHRGEWERLKANPGLLPQAVEEILRWVTPITHFTRVATEDCEVRGEKIRAGEQLALYYASANRDEEVFEDPFAFRIDRRPNRHLAFGVGEHVCLGAHLARVELETIFRHLLRRLEAFELAGPVQRLSSAVNGGIKHLPLRYRLT